MIFPMIFIGIDPGLSGGIAILQDTGEVVCAVKMPATEQDVFKVLSNSGRGWVKRYAFIEKVGATPQMGVVSAFTFGRGYGALLMALTAAAVPFDQVSPVKWQTEMACRSGGDKNVTKRRAQQLFPSLTITHATADALLMAEYCRRMKRGQ